MSLTIPDASPFTTRADLRRRPAMSVGQIARTLVLLLACTAALGAMTRRGHAGEAAGVAALADGAWAPAGRRAVVPPPSSAPSPA